MDERGAQVPRLAQAFANGAARSLLGRAADEGRESARDLREARETFSRFVALEAAHDPALIDLYADEGLVVERWIEHGVEKPSRAFPLARYKQMLREALKVSAKAGEGSLHANVSYEHRGPGWVVVRSRRDYSHSRAAAPYEATLRRQPDGQWRVTEEVATIVV